MIIKQKFKKTCSKYKFVNDFVDSLINPRDEYTIYVFNDGSTGNGGLGDRLGGMITKIDPLKRYVMLSNGQTQPWSVQIPNAIFYKKISEEEKKDEIRKEVLSEINIDTHNDLKKKIKVLMTKINNINEENDSLKKKNDKLNNQLKKIQIEITKKK